MNALRTVGVGLAVLLSGPALGMGCVVATDEAGDQVPHADLISASLSEEFGELGVAVTVADLSLISIETTYVVHWVDGEGKGYYAGIGVGIVPTVAGQDPSGLSMTVDTGTYDPASGSYTWNPESDGPVWVEGNTLHALVSPKLIGEPSGRLTGIGAFSGEYANYIPFDSTDSDGEWNYGDNCDKSAALKDTARAGGAVAGAGAGGLGVLLLALCGWRRRLTA